MSAPFFLGEMDQEVASTKIDYTQLIFFQKSKSSYFMKNLDLVLFLFGFILENKKLTILKNIKKNRYTRANARGASSEPEGQLYLPGVDLLLKFHVPLNPIVRTKIRQQSRRKF